MTSPATHSTACILCSVNCGLEIHLDDQGQFSKIVGDKQHPISKGYMCQKATRLNYYQQQKRLNTPLRRKADGSFEPISWETALREIADKLVHIRDTHGGETIAYAGGGGQGNHFPGVYASATRAALRTPYLYSALAQEKTGNFWVNGKLFGKQNSYYEEPVDEAGFVLIIGANPMQSHGIPRARKVINDLARDPARKLVVVDPRKTETARKADVHLQVKPGKDAFLMAAMLGMLVQQELVDQEFIATHTVGFEAIKPHFMRIPVEEYVEIAGLELAEVQQITREMAAARTVCIRSDLGIEMSYNSTLNAYLKRLLFLLTGNFGKKGTNHLVSFLFPLVGNSREPEQGGVLTQVTQTKEIGKLFPPNMLPLEIDSGHPKRLRALIVESANPLSSYADLPAQRKAYRKLDLMVVIDVAMTETARAAHYVLPASSQYEKYEATFFKDNFAHLRRPILPPLEGTLPEFEIHTRLLRAMGELPASFPLLTAIARLDRRFPRLKLFQLALGLSFRLRPRWQPYAIVLLKETLGKALPEGMAPAAFLWFSAHLYAQKYPKAVRQAGIKGQGYALGEALFQRILHSPSGVVISQPDMQDHWQLIAHKDKKVHLHIPELLQWLDELPQTHQQQEQAAAAYPFNLIAGERRSYNANTILRNPEWRKSDREGGLKIHPLDAERLGIQSGELVRCYNDKGSIRIVARVVEEATPGVLSMPNAYGLVYEEEAGADPLRVGAAANELTSAHHCDPLAKTPYHKNVRVALEKVSHSTA